MPLLQFLPWCKLGDDHRVGAIKLRRFVRGSRVDDVDAITSAHISSILNSYKSNDGAPAKDAVVIQFEGCDLLHDLSQQELDETIQLVQIATFTALANNDYFGHFRAFPPKRCNSTDFQLFTQRFEDEPTYTTFQVRVPEGYSESRGWPNAKLSICRPIHATNQVIRFDEALLKALLQHRQAMPRDWARLSNAIISFNFANTCDSNVLPQIEWVLLLSAFQQALAAQKKGTHVAKKLRDYLKCTKEVLGKNSQRNSASQAPEEPLRYHWMKEFYDLRGEFAHGKLVAQKPAKWTPAEHLCLARIAFPLLIRCLLEQTKLYSLTQHDYDQLAVFERFADMKFFPDQNTWVANGGSLWDRLLTSEREGTQLNEMKEIMRKRLATIEREPRGSCAP